MRKIDKRNDGICILAFPIHKNHKIKSGTVYRKTIYGVFLMQISIQIQKIEVRQISSVKKEKYLISGRKTFEN